MTRCVIVMLHIKPRSAKVMKTDRGRVYLKYGPPNIISRKLYEPSSYPYEIWHYYVLGDNQRNKNSFFITHGYDHE